MGIRANVGINPALIPDQQLMGEFRELLMVLGALDSNEGQIKGYIAEQFNFGPGHINFLKNHLIYCKRRHEFVKRELLDRGFHVTMTMNLDGYDQRYMNDWNPTINDSKIVRIRVIERLKNKSENFWKLRKKKLTKEELYGLVEAIDGSACFEV